MPKVGKKKYAYTPKGRAAAKKAAKSTANTRTPQTARQRSVVAKRKIASQVRSASQGVTKPKEPSTLAEIGKALIKMGTSYVNAPAAQQLLNPLTGGVLGDAAKAVTALAKPKPKAKAKESGSYEARRKRASVKPAAAKPTDYKNPPKKTGMTQAQAARVRKYRTIESQVGAATGGQTTKAKAREPELRELVKEIRSKRKK